MNLLAAGDLAKNLKTNYDLIVERAMVLVQFREAAYDKER